MSDKNHIEHELHKWWMKYSQTHTINKMPLSAEFAWKTAWAMACEEMLDAAKTGQCIGSLLAEIERLREEVKKLNITGIQKKENVMVVVVLTEFKEIFCGECDDPWGDVLMLKNARQAIFFSEETHGLLGLAANGPAEGSRIGPVVEEMRVARPVNVIKCSAEAVKKWESAEWS